MAEAPLDVTPIALAPETYDRHAAAVDYVEGQIRTRAPWPGTGRFPGLAPGAWGLLANGDTISARSGTTLGTGSVKLCDRDGGVITGPYDDSESVDVSNAGAAITASGADRIVMLTWILGEWAAACSGGS